jgi:hypothetical protein
VLSAGASKKEKARYGAAVPGPLGLLTTKSGKPGSTAAPVFS